MSNLSHDDLIERGLHQKDELIKECEKLEAQNKKLRSALINIAKIGLRCPYDKCDAEEGVKSARLCLKEIGEK